MEFLIPITIVVIAFIPIVKQSKAREEQGKIVRGAYEKTILKLVISSKFIDAERKLFVRLILILTYPNRTDLLSQEEFEIVEAMIERLRTS